MTVHDTEVVNSYDVIAQQVIYNEIVKLLRYLTRDPNWANTFQIAINVDSFIEKMKSDRTVSRLLWADGNIPANIIAKIVISVAVRMGVAVIQTGRIR